MKKTLLGLLVILSMVLLAACGGKKDATEAKGEPKVVTYNLQSNPPSMDPQLNTDSTSGNVLGHVMEGLTTLGPDGNPIPGVAESWKTEGNVWTFTLRKDAKWHNGDPVVAGDFAAAWERALKPTTASEYAFIMYSIKGAQEYNEGKTTDFTTVGVKAVDDTTLVVELKEPVTYFDSLVAFFTFLPQNQKFYEEHKDAYATSSEEVMGNGPYKMASWDFENKIVLEKSDTYWNKDNTKIDTIEMPIIVDYAAALKAYQNDELDWTVLPNDEITKFKDSPELAPMQEARVIYMLLNHKFKLFSNEKVRRAVAMSIDRQTLVDKIKSGAGAVAEGLVPNIIPGKAGFFRDEFPQSAYGLSYNPEEAKKLFAEGLKELGMTLESIPEITILTKNDDTSVKESQFYQEQLKVNLGLNIKIEPVTFQIRLQRQTAKDYELMLAGWGADYNDPMTFLDMWMTKSGQNNTNWGSPAYDKLITDAKAENDPAKRMDMLGNAEKILMDEAVIVPTFYRMKMALKKPHIEGVVINPFSPVVSFNFADIKK